MLYAILAYHVEAEVMSWTPEADAALMTDLQGVHDRLKQRGQLGPSMARLPRPRSSCWGFTSSTAPPRRPRSRPPATCAASIRQPSTRSAPSSSICPACPSRPRRRLPNPTRPERSPRPIARKLF